MKKTRKSGHKPPGGGTAGFLGDYSKSRYAFLVELAWLASQLPDDLTAIDEWTDKLSPDHRQIAVAAAEYAITEMRDGRKREDVDEMLGALAAVAGGSGALRGGGSHYDSVRVVAALRKTLAPAGPGKGEFVDAICGFLPAVKWNDEEDKLRVESIMGTAPDQAALVDDWAKKLDDSDSCFAVLSGRKWTGHVPCGG